MTITRTVEGDKTTLKIDGRLDAVTSAEFEKELETVEKSGELILDLSGLEYISSAGLRLILAAQKHIGKNGNMVVRNVTPEVMEIFEVTGFTGVLDIE
ncbi:MAG: STAS domain-containing protein [Sphaerochaetaceae bacterium]|nr:STAS domain-containing protein [Sphaerochaetaceae bacterium]